MDFLRRLVAGDQPNWPTQPSAFTLIPGYEDLEVVGESHYQEALRAAAGPASRVEVTAVLYAEIGSPYDANAISVWVQGRKVGYLSREDAAVVRPGLLRLQDQLGSRIALRGDIVAGGPVGTMGLFLNWDPAAFGIAPPSPQEVVDSVKRQLESERAPVTRHFLYAGLEDALYARRDEPSALDLFDQTCASHDAEMPQIRPALLAEFHNLPRIQVYHQSVIRHQKAQDWSRALWWAERGLNVYGNDALAAENVEDLRKKAAKCRLKLGD